MARKRWDPSSRRGKKRRTADAGGDDGSDDHQESEQEGDLLDEEDFDSLMVTEERAPVWAPPSFMTREAYKALQNEGLTALPPEPGVGLRYHRSSSQWHAVFGCHNVAPSWGSLRSERKALLIALYAIWNWFATENPRDSAAADHVECLRIKRDACDF